MLRQCFYSFFFIALSIAGSASTATAWESFAPPLTLSERIAESGTVAFGEFLNLVEPVRKDGLLYGRYRILDVANSREAVEKGAVVVAAGKGRWKAGEHALLTNIGKGRWKASPPISRACFDYALAAPDPKQEDSRRVPYFLRNLNSSDRQISDDAFVELERAPMRAIVASAKLIPREFVAARLQDDATDKLRVGLYGQMLGLAGNESDRKLLRGLIENAPGGKDSFVPGMGGIVGGYLLLAGADGLDWIDASLLKEVNQDIPFWHGYGTLVAVQFMWEFGEGRISRPRLRESMRRLLDDPRIADLAINELVRWEDWSLHDRLLAMMNNPKFEEIWFKRAIMRYMARSSAVPPEIQAHNPDEFYKADRLIREVRAARPKWFASAAFLLVPDHGTYFASVDPPQHSESQKRRDQTSKRLKSIGAAVFIGDRLAPSEGFVAEVNANRTKVTDDDLKGVGEFLKMTDLSLEETAITDKGLAHLTKLDRLVWLNLYRTKISDEGLRHVAKLKQLKLLPIGETKVTDKGLAHLKKMKQLTYLGLRGNKVTDQGVAHLAGLTKLTSLYLGETKVTDAGLESLARMSKLQKLWLNTTAVSDNAVPLLGNMKSLRELHIEQTKLTGKGVLQLRKLLPLCEIHDGRE